MKPRGLPCNISACVQHLRAVDATAWVGFLLPCPCFHRVVGRVLFPTASACSPLSLVLPALPLLCCWYMQVVRNERSCIVIPSVALPLFQQALGVAVGMINS